MAYLTNKLLYQILFISIFSIYFYTDSLFVILFAFILSFCTFRFSITFILAILDFIHQLFFAFFARDIKSYDIWLFFTHIDETFETFNQIQSIAIYPLIKLLLFTTIIYIISKKEFFKFRLSLLFIAMFIYIFPLSFTSIYFTNEIISFFITLPNKYKTQKIIDENIKPISNSDKNIIFIFGESLREDIFRDGEFYKTYSKQNNFFYNRCISLATNTDVVLPLFINATNDLTNLNDNRNLFKLAKKQNYNTYFFSTQYDKALKYIKPYLALEYIDFYANGTKDSFDDFLLTKIKEIDFNKKNFVILQMYGEHSPYKRYPKEYQKYFPKDTSLNEQIKSDYQNSFLYTEYILDTIIKYIKTQSKKETIIIFASDHAELIKDEYGHNQFKKDIYTVPSFVYTINSDFICNQQNIYQLDLVNIILKNLGYKQIDINKPYKVNGTMITGEDGYILVD